MATKVEGVAGTPERAEIGSVVDTDIAGRLDRLPWGRFHVLVIVALGITWVLDGLEVTLAGSLVGALRQPPMSFSEFDVGLAASSYLIGAVTGAVGFGWLTDRIGRKKLFFITLALYLVATAATGLSWNVASFCFFRFLTGAGIGGEYTAINSTIQELVPASARGWTNLVINGSFWIGAALGSFMSIVLLKPEVIDPAWGWRVAFLTGGAIGLVILFLRRWIPEARAGLRPTATPPRPTGWSRASRSASPMRASPCRRRTRRSTPRSGSATTRPSRTWCTRCS